MTILPGPAVETSTQHCEAQQRLLSVKPVSWPHGSILVSLNGVSINVSGRKLFFIVTLLNSGIRS